MNVLFQYLHINFLPFFTITGLTPVAYIISKKIASSSCSNSCGSSTPNGSLRDRTCVWLFTKDKTLPKNISHSLYFHPHAIMYVLNIKHNKHFCVTADISIVLVLLIGHLLGWKEEKFKILKLNCRSNEYAIIN